jgi:Fe-S cluster assembly ATPase SufC
MPGSILLNGHEVNIANPAQARRQGIGMVFQHFSLFETLTVAENIALVLDEPLRPAGLAAARREVSERYGLPLDPDRMVHSLSVGERQRVEIVRCLLQKPQAADPRRADLGADAAGRRSCSRRCASWPPKASRSSTSATSCTKSSRCATTRRLCGTARSPARPCRARKRRRAWRA